MKRMLLMLGILGFSGSVWIRAQAPRGGGAQPDPGTPAYWSAQRIREYAETTMKPRVNPDTHNGGVSLIPSSSFIYRDGDSEAEIHQKAGDVIFVHEGEGAIVVGGKMTGGRQERPDELRGTSIEGGTRYSIATGNSIYIPANMPHQFFVEIGKHFVITIVKVTP